MNHRNTSFVRVKRASAFLLCLFMTVALLLPGFAGAAEGGKTVRVGWYSSPWDMKDQFQRRVGFAYEYQRYLSAFTNWDYEYVEGSWPELLEMLKRGEIDLLSDVSFTEERAESMLFPSYSMGTEDYYIFLTADNDEYVQGDYTFFNGKKIGVNRGSIMETLLENWTRTHGIEAQITGLTGTEEESVELLKNGGIDAFVTIDAYGGIEDILPVAKIGGSDYYFAVNKERPDLLNDLEYALSRIQDENRFYNQMMYEKYVRNTGANVFVNAEELKWLSAHGAIRVGYLDNYLAYCAEDPDTGELTGALKDYLEAARDCIANTQLSFEPLSYPNSAAALEALKNGEVDCVFPSNLNPYDAEQRNVDLTPPVMNAEVYAIVRPADQKTLGQKKTVTAAVVEGDTNDEAILKDHFPNWDAKHYETVRDCLAAISNGSADCLLISSYRYNNLVSLCDDYKLTSMSTGVNTEYSFAVNHHDVQMYSILSRVSSLVQETSVSASLTRYFAEDTRTGLIDFVKANPTVVIAIIVVIIAMVVVIIAQYRAIRAERKAEASRHQVADLNKRVYVDALTSVGNKAGFNDYTLKLQHRLDFDGDLSEFAVAMFDCDDLKLVNDRCGHDKGDVYLQTAAHNICSVFRHSPVFRIGGDEFAVFLLGEDYQNRETLRELFEKSVEESRGSAENAWERVSVAMGMAEYEPSKDASADDVIRRADQIMYENKRLRKQART